MRTLQKEHREQAQCKDSRERKERTYVCVCVCVRARKSEIAELATGCLGCVLLHQLVSVQCAACACVCVHVCQWMCKSWSPCCSMQTLVRVRVEYQCGVVHCT